MPEASKLPFAALPWLVLALANWMGYLLTTCWPPSPSSRCLCLSLGLQSRGARARACGRCSGAAVQIPAIQVSILRRKTTDETTWHIWRCRRSDICAVTHANAGQDSLRSAWLGGYAACRGWSGERKDSREGRGAYISPLAAALCHRHGLDGVAVARRPIRALL